MARLPLLLALMLAAAPATALAAPDLIVYSSSRCDQAGDLGPQGPTFDGSRPCDPELWTVRDDGADDRQLTFNGVTDTAPAWSPDGLRIALARGVPAEHGFSRIHVIGADGSGGTRISNGSRDNGIDISDGWPSWSPLGDRVAFTAGFPGDTFSVRPDGSGLVRLGADPRHEMQPAFSPDGSRLAFTRFAASDENAVGLGNAAIWIAPALGGPALPITSGDVQVEFTNFSFSPDCTRIAFTTGGRVHVVSTLGGPIQALGPPGSNDPDWSPDGSSLVYSAATPGPDGRVTNNLFVTRATGSEAPPVQITRIAGGSGATNPDWAPDGAFLPLCRRADVLAPVIELVEGSLDQIVRLLPIGRASVSAGRPPRVRARDLHYFAVDRSGIRSLEVAFDRRGARRRPAWVRIRSERDWRRHVRRLRAGDYTVLARARDGRGNRTRRPLAARVRLTRR